MKIKKISYEQREHIMDLVCEVEKYWTVDTCACNQYDLVVMAKDYAINPVASTSNICELENQLWQELDALVRTTFEVCPGATIEGVELVSLNRLKTLFWVEGGRAKMLSSAVFRS